MAKNFTAQKIKFPQETAYLVTFTDETVNGKLHVLCSVGSVEYQVIWTVYKTKISWGSSWFHEAIIQKLFWIFLFLIFEVYNLEYGNGLRFCWFFIVEKL